MVRSRSNCRIYDRYWA